MSRSVTLRRWGRVQRGAHGQCAEEAGVAQPSGHRGSASCGNLVPSAGWMELLRDFPEEVTMVRFVP